MKKTNNSQSLFLLFAAGLPALLLAPSVSAQEWTRFRGPNGTGVSSAKTIPVQFTPKDYNWRTELPGEGHASPVLWGDRIFLTSADESAGKRYVLCLSAKTGKILWKDTGDFSRYHHHELNSSASATPTVDANAVYVTWSTQDSFTVQALSHAGKPLWKKEFGAFPTQHGGAASPIIVGDVLIVTKEPENGDGALLGLNRKTGEIRWQRKRDSLAAPYATPMLYQNAGGVNEVIFASTAHGITSLEPATGKVNWELDGLFRQRCVGSPVLADGLIVVTSGNGGGDRLAYAVKPGTTSGQAAKTVYRLGRGTSYVPTPIVVGKRVFFWGDNGIVTCVESATGKTVWSERVGGNFYGSPVAINGKLYALNTRGDLCVIEAGDTFRLLAKSELGEESHATPAVANGVLYLRTVKHLISVGGK